MNKKIIVIACTFFLNFSIFALAPKSTINDKHKIINIVDEILVDMNIGYQLNPVPVMLNPKQNNLDAFCPLSNNEGTTLMITHLESIFDKNYKAVPSINALIGLYSFDRIYQQIISQGVMTDLQKTKILPKLRRKADSFINWKRYTTKTGVNHLEFSHYNFHFYDFTSQVAFHEPYLVDKYYIIPEFLNPFQFRYKFLQGQNFIICGLFFKECHYSTMIGVILSFVKAHMIDPLKFKSINIYIPTESVFDNDLRCQQYGDYSLYVDFIFFVRNVFNLKIAIHDEMNGSHALNEKNPHISLYFVRNIENSTFLSKFIRTTNRNINLPHKMLVRYLQYLAEKIYSINMKIDKNILMAA